MLAVTYSLQHNGVCLTPAALLRFTQLWSLTAHLQLIIMCLKALCLIDHVAMLVFNWNSWDYQ